MEFQNKYKKLQIIPAIALPKAAPTPKTRIIEDAKSIENFRSTQRILCRYIVYTPHGIDPGSPWKNNNQFDRILKTSLRIDTFNFMPSPSNSIEASISISSICMTSEDSLFSLSVGSECGVRSPSASPLCGNSTTTHNDHFPFVHFKHRIDNNPSVEVNWKKALQPNFDPTKPLSVCPINCPKPTTIDETTEAVDR